VNKAQIKATKAKFQTDPSAFFRRVLGVKPEGYQDRILEVVAANQRTAIAACHDVGKSFSMARIVLWFAICFPRSKVITTAPTFNQVKNILWSEIRSAHARSRVPLGGTMLQTEWQLSAHGDWFAIGFTPRNEVTGGEGQGTASSFQGFHAEGGILVVFDEATGVPHNTWNMAEGLLTQAHVKFVAIGNPTSKNSEFFQCFKSPDWAKVYLSCFDSPNLIANGIHDMRSLEAELDLLRSMNDGEVQARLKAYSAPVPYLLSAQWVMGRALKWGLKHPLFVSKVLGAFPEEGDNTLMPLGLCELSQRRIVEPRPSDRKVLGIDVARFGTDSSVLTYIHGPKFIAKKTLIKRDNMEVVGETLAFCKAHEWPDVIVIDATGLGSGVVDRLKELQNEFPPAVPPTTEIRAVQFGAGVECFTGGCAHTAREGCERSKYVNVKARMFDLLAQALKADLALPDEDVYLDELPTILYAYNSKGQMVIESKDDYKKRTGRGSPDHADSLALANFGRHDESLVGSFAKGNFTAPPPMASGLKSGDTW
jgi:phage terminase large subunit